jgi:hypothetical protein
MLTNRIDIRILLFITIILTVFTATACPAAGIPFPDNIGGKFSPYALPDLTDLPLWIPPLAGLAAGILSAAAGTGGGFMVVPALMSFGVAGIYAVGAEMFRIFIFTLVQTIRLIIRKKVRYIFSGVLSIGTALGGFAGLWLSIKIYMGSPPGSNIFISLMIVMWLISYAFIIVPDFRESAARYAAALRLEKEKSEKDINPDNKADEEKTENINPDETEAKPETPPEKDIKPQIESFESHQINEEPWDIAKKIRGIKIFPYLSFPSSLKFYPPNNGLKENEIAQEELNTLKKQHDRISALPVFLFSLAGGFFMSLIGSGGLIFGFTILTRGFACLGSAMIGADFTRIAISSGFLTIGGFGLKGFITIYSVSGLILGSVAGVHIGGHALEYIKPHKVKGLISLTIISVIINRLLAIPDYLRLSGADLSYNLCSTLNESGRYILIIGTGIAVSWFIYELFAGIKSKLAGRTKEEAGK